MNPFDMSADDLRVRIGEIPFEWLAWRDAYRGGEATLLRLSNLDAYANGVWEEAGSVRWPAMFNPPPCGLCAGYCRAFTR